MVEARVLAAQRTWGLYSEAEEQGRALTYKAAEAYNGVDKYVKKGQVDFETVKLISMAKIFVSEIGTERRSPTSTGSSPAARAGSRSTPSRRWGEVNRLFRIGGGNGGANCATTSQS